MRWKLFIISVVLFSSVSAENSIDFGVGAGYRHDNMHWALYDDQGYNFWDMKYENMQSAEIEGYVKGVCKYVYLHAYADYAWILSGKNKTALLFDPNLNPNQIPILGVGGAFRFSIPVRGWLADAEAAGGFEIPFWEKGSRHVFLTPFAGACIHRQFIHYKTPDPRSSLVTQLPPEVPFNSASLTPYLSSFSSTWWGPLLGFNLDLRPVDSFELEVGYSRLFLAYKQKQNLSGMIMLDVAGTLVPETVLINTKSKFQHLQGNQVRGKIAYYVFPFWKLGFSGNFIHMKTPTKRKMDLFESVKIPDFGVFFDFTNFLNTKSNWIMYDFLLESGFVF